MSPFETLYGMKYNAPINWNDPVNMVFIGPDMLKEMRQEIANIW